MPRTGCNYNTCRWSHRTIIVARIEGPDLIWWLPFLDARATRLRPIWTCGNPRTESKDDFGEEGVGPLGFIVWTKMATTDEFGAKGHGQLRLIIWTKVVALRRREGPSMSRHIRYLDKVQPRSGVEAASTQTSKISVGKPKEHLNHAQKLVSIEIDCLDKNGADTSP